MYINSTNIIYKTYDNEVMPTWYTSEKYYNCENFHTRLQQKKRKLFSKK